MHYKFIALRIATYINIPRFKDLVKTIRFVNYKIKMEKTIPKKIPFLTPCLPLEASDKEDKKEESEYVTFTLKVRAGTGASAPSYKMKVAKFEDGTPAEWIEVLDSLEEIWKQNSMTSAADREASVKTILREDALTAFESSIDDSQPDDDEDRILDVAMIQKALNDVAKNIFPHRALEIQKLWMRRAVRKPKEMTIRKLVAVITKMNKSLARFPGASEDDKFEPDEILEIIEWALPVRWRAKFDLDTYVPSLHDKARLIKEAEAIERSEAVLGVKPKAQETKEKKPSKSRNPKKVQHPKSDKTSTDYYCTEHGHNKTHATADCFTIKNRNGNNKDKPNNNRAFSTKKFQKEINLLSKGKNKNKILNLYAAEINNQRAQIKKKGKKTKAKSKRKQSIESSDESTSEEENDPDLHIVDCPIEPEVRFAKAPNSKKRKVTSDEESGASAEEGAFLKKIANLGQNIDDESTVESEESTD